MQHILLGSAGLAAMAPCSILATAGASLAIGARIVFVWTAASATLGILNELCSKIEMLCQKDFFGSPNFVSNWTFSGLHRIAYYLRGPMPSENDWTIRVVDNFNKKTGAIDKERPEIYQIYDVKKNEYYTFYPSCTIGAKCIVISFWISSYVLGYMALHICRAILVPCVGELSHSLSSAYEQRKSLFKAFCAHVWKVPELVSKELSAVVLAPYYGIKIQMAALYGIRYPLEGQKWIASIETAWHNGKARNKDLFRGRAFDRANNRTEETDCWPRLSESLFNLFSRSEFEYTFFLAHCMQPLKGKQSDELHPMSLNSTGQDHQRILQRFEQ